MRVGRMLSVLDFRYFIVAAVFVANNIFVIGAAQAVDEIIAFGHVIKKYPSGASEGRIEIDGKVYHNNWGLKIEEIDIVAGVPVVLGKSGPGGNSCEWTPFIISFPNGKGPRFDGPIDTCWLVYKESKSDGLLFSTPASAEGEGRKWSWTPEGGIKDDGPIKFARNTKKSWADLRTRDLTHPVDLLDYGAVTDRLDELVGDRKSQLIATVNGPGSGRYEGDWFIGDACQRHNCPGPDMGAGAITVVDIAGRRLFVAWKPNGKKIEVRPPIGEWPSEARQPLALWAKEFEPVRSRR